MTRILFVWGTLYGIADPWYTGDFDATWRDVSEGCEALLATLMAKATKRGNDDGRTK